MKRAIENPYNVSHKIYILLVVIFAIILCTIIFGHLGINALVVDIIKNLSYGCIASTVVAWLIDCANIRSANKKANDTYDAVAGFLTSSFFLEKNCYIPTLTIPV